jgi:hypothetical protein
MIPVGKPRIWLTFALTVTVAALAAELARAIVQVAAYHARRELGQGRSVEALRAANWGAVIYPYDIKVNYSRLVALKRLGRWEKLAEKAREVMDWHPEGAPVMRLLGEAAWNQGLHEEAAETLWASFWREPNPDLSSAQLWRLAMLAGEQTWGSNDRRVMAAALRTQTLASQDPTINDVERQRAIRDSAKVLERAGQPLSPGVSPNFIPTSPDKQNRFPLQE